MIHKCDGSRGTIISASIILDYKGNESAFSFVPSLDAPLKASDDKAVIYYGGQSTDVAITVSGTEDNVLLYIVIALLIVLLIILAIYLLIKHS